MNVRKATFIFIPLAALAMTGCAARYTHKSDSASDASLTLVRGAKQLGAKSLQVYEAYYDGSCTKAQNTGRLAALSTYASQSKEVKVETHRPLFILASTSLWGTAVTSTPGAAFDLTRNDCINLISFSPVPAHNYELKQDYVGSSCGVSVVDLTTSLAPPDLVKLDPRSCPGPQL